MTAIQDRIPHNHCYGCGPENPDGLQIKSYWDGKESVCTYMPRPEQCAGPTQYLYGGTIASIVDCHSVCTSIANYYGRDGLEVGEALYGAPPPERIAASFGAPPLAEPVNPPVDTTRLRRPERLVRPGLAAV